MVKLRNFYLSKRFFLCSFVFILSINYVVLRATDGIAFETTATAPRAKVLRKKPDEELFISIPLPEYVELKSLKNTYETREKFLNQTYETREKFINQTYEKTIEDSKRNRKKLLATQAVRCHLQLIESVMGDYFTFPSKNQMMYDLQKDNSVSFEKFEVSIHRVKLLYFLKYSNSSLAEEMNALLEKYGINLIEFSYIVREIYSKTRDIVHIVTEPLTKEDILNGLKHSRIYGNALQDVAAVLYEMHNIRLARKYAEK